MRSKIDHSFNGKFLSHDILIQCQCLCDANHLLSLDLNDLLLIINTDQSFRSSEAETEKKFRIAFIQKPECLIISQFWNKTLSDSKDISIFYLPKKWDDTTPQNVSERHSNPGLSKIPPSLVKDRPLPDSFILQFPVSRSPKSPRIISKVFFFGNISELPQLALGSSCWVLFFCWVGLWFHLSRIWFCLSWLCIEGTL